jgi:hypothetical protein
MRTSCFAAIAVANLLSLAPAQVRDAGSSEIRKEWVLGEHIARDLDQRDGRVDDAALLAYLQRIENRIAAVASASPAEIRVTGSAQLSADLLPNAILYLSVGMLARIETEAELAGLLAHELAHSQHGNPVATRSGGVDIHLPPCVLVSPLTPLTWGARTHDEEVLATKDGVRYMALADYDPLSAVELLSRLAYENPGWSKAIRSEDLLDLRATLEVETPPDGGYILNRSGFVEQHAGIVARFGKAVGKTSQPSLSSQRKP